MKHAFVLLIIFLSMLVGKCLLAHEVRPAYLELLQIGPETYDVFWKVPARGDLRLGIYVRLPENCQSTMPPKSYLAGGAFIERRSVTCKGGLTNNMIIIDGLSATVTDVLARVERSDGTTQVVRLTPSTPSFTVEAVPSRTQVVGTYLLLGVEHILFGIDHLLFVLALILLVKGWKRVIVTITAFTVAHSITLAAATLGFVHIPQKPVEAAIALSIVFVASEIVHSHRGNSGLAERLPWIIAFLFGLLHGFGFAGALREVGLPEQSIPLALLFFNIGVELGQLLFIAVVMSFLFVFKRFLAVWKVPVFSSISEAKFNNAIAYVIGSVAFFWVFERVYAFWR